MAKYQAVKLIGAAFFAAIFAGWLWLQWSNPIMRVIAGGLLFMTIVFTWKAHVADDRRVRSGRLAVSQKQRSITITHHDESKTIALQDVARAVWRNDSEANMGLWLYDNEGKALAHIDGTFVAHEAEARKFLAWLRTLVDVPFQVSWPAAESV